MLVIVLIKTAKLSLDIGLNDEMTFCIENKYSIKPLHQTFIRTI